MLKKQYPNIEIIENGKNLGFAAGNNVGIRKAMRNKADYILLLNNDTVVDPKFLTGLVEVAEKNENIGIVGPKIYQYENREKVLLSGAKILFWKGCVPKGHDLNKTTDVDMVSGCCMLIKKEVIETVGLLDETYFFGWEDAEYCINAQENGYRVICTPIGKIWHKVGGSYGGYYASNPTVLTEGIRNQLIFINRHASHLEKISSIFFMVPQIGRVVFWRAGNVNEIKIRAIAVKKGFINFRFYKRMMEK
ncbi:hypothetical protein SDC9_85193 [bioreactor metagenome]|uniref:Glycosyltransferase 2-like domain-containing protein n=1 Tax=bioreactor metagenome TaxID=1076179 RepID=A0A644ZLD3_9ZZZZ